MNDEVSKSLAIASPDDIGAPLPPWTYTNPELFELEYDAFFLRRWQFVGAHPGAVCWRPVLAPMKLQIREGGGTCSDLGFQGVGLGAFCKTRTS